MTNPLTLIVSLIITPRGSSELYMFVLGLTDLCVVCLRLTLKTLENVDYSWSEISCKCLLFLINHLYLYSNWIVVGWTLERFVAVEFPMRMNAWSTMRNVKLILILFFIGSALIMIPEITEVHLQLSPTSLTYFCWYTDIYFKKNVIFQTIMYIYIPILMVSSSNLVIIYKVKQASKKRTTITANGEIVQQRAKEQRQMTLTLLVVLAAFVFLHIPQIIAKVLQAMYPDTDAIFKRSANDFFYFLHRHLYRISYNRFPE